MTAAVWRPRDSEASGQVAELPLGVRGLTARASSAAGTEREVAALAPGVAEVRVTPDAPSPVRLPPPCTTAGARS
ncbi:hypothetical protein [Nonomuraea typhae]|uniref:Uncharacterized protein n=1 Tax=Nonomuraea typhae TaxID=2603600 RepID=A0ABW7YNQ2_9ACTN